MTKSPHFWWLISLLGLTIIALIAFIITKRICNSESLMEYVSVCSMVLSITLSIFAIQYTYHSNNEINRQFEKINSIADNIKVTSENLASTNALLKDNLGKILENLENVGHSQQEMVNQLSNITNRGVNTDFNNLTPNNSVNKVNNSDYKNPNVKLS